MHGCSFLACDDDVANLNKKKENTKSCLTFFYAQEYGLTPVPLSKGRGE
jgi:hypothetical protein